MGKDKLRRFRENLTFDCFVQPEFDEVFHCDHPLKGRWRSDFFRNDNPIVLELGCGKGEYTVALADTTRRATISASTSKAPACGAAQDVTERKIANAGFLRTRVEFINGLFAENEVDEIWITFPIRSSKAAGPEALTSPLFLEYYARLLKPAGWINLKTDSKHLFAYTNEVVRRYTLPCVVSNPDIYGSGYADEVLSVKTAYEKRFSKWVFRSPIPAFAGRTAEFPWFDWEEDEKEERTTSRSAGYTDPLPA
ncbi:MAG: tRNA (guanosine(46)-N7)-methyltransferase TrmB [Alistipes finegoldii]